MAATFDPSLPTDRDWLRFRLSDVGGLSGTTVTAPLAQDETYDALLAETSDRTTALRTLAQSFIAQFGQQVTRFQAGGGVGFEWAERVRIWREVVEEADRALGVGSGTIYLERHYVGQDEYA